MPHEGFALREQQCEAVTRALHLNDTRREATLLAGTQWKVLIYDRFGKEIVTELMRKGDLRQHNVTLYLDIAAPREPIPDVIAIYLVDPVPDNVMAIAGDCERGLYESVHINFIRPAPKEMLELLAEQTLLSQSLSTISKVHDQFLNFLSLEDSLFSLQLPHCFSSFHDNTLSDAQVEHHIDSVASGLVSVLVTLGSVPVIRCPQGDQIAHAVCSRVDAMVRQLREQRHGPLSDSVIGRMNNFQRPLLLICERSFDISSCLVHPRTYQALCHDIFGIRSNVVHCEVEGKMKSFALDATNDPFWKDHRFHDIPTVAEANDREVQRFREKSQSMNARGDGTELEHSTAQLSNAMNMLPELRLAKQRIDMHTSLLTLSFAQMKARHFDRFFEIEPLLADNRTLTTQDREKVIELLRDDSVGTPEDKLRLILLLIEASNNDAAKELASIERQLAGCAPLDLTPIKQWASMQSFRSTTNPSAPSANAQTSTSSSLQSSQLWSVAMKVASNVKTLIGSGKGDVRITELLDQFLANSSAEAASHPYFDPKLGQAGEQPPTSRRKDPFKDAIVCVIGGANYVESQSLAQYAATPNSSGQTRNIVYGGTHITSPNDLLGQLSALHQQQNPSSRQGEAS